MVSHSASLGILVTAPLLGELYLLALLKLRPLCPPPPPSSRGAAPSSQRLLCAVPPLPLVSLLRHSVPTHILLFPTSLPLGVCLAGLFWPCSRRPHVSAYSLLHQSRPRLARWLPAAASPCTRVPHHPSHGAKPCLTLLVRHGAPHPTGRRSFSKSSCCLPPFHLVTRVHSMALGHD